MRIDALSSKDVTTKFGVKPTFSFKADDGQWYNTGFKAHGLAVGDAVEFEFENTRFGNQVKMDTLKKGNGAAVATAPAAPRQYGTRVFPIPVMHGDRAIVRQNSVTNAARVFGAMYSHGSLFDEVSTVEGAAEVVIRMARHFESYACGDADRLGLTEGTDEPTDAE